MLVLNVWVEAEDGVEDKAPHDSWETLLVDLPLQGEGIPISWPWWGVLEKSNWAGQAGRGLRVKVNLPIFKDEKTKDAVTYHLWQGDSYFLLLRLGQPILVAIHLMVITGVPWRPCQQFWWGCYPNQSYRCWTSAMPWWWCLMPLVSSSIPSSKVPGRMWLSLECACCSRFRYLSQSTLEEFNRSMWSRRNEIICMRAWTLNIGICWLTKWMVNAPLATPTCSLQPGSWKDGQKPEIPCSWRPSQWEDQMLPSHRHQEICFPLGSWRAIVPSSLNPP